ncbi:MAG TPA: hypothetical protein VFT50_15120 [Baekduia sp.]|nr:hypothetical protein [Baekduia sp.]
MRRLLPTVAVLAAATAGCGGTVDGAHQAAPDPAAQAAPTPHPSRPGLGSRALVTLERQDLRFGRHDTLTVAPDGRANLVLAHGGGGFRNATCAFSASEMTALRHDLRRMPVDEPAPPRQRPQRPRPRNDGVIVDRPPYFAVTYRGRRDVFMGDAMPADGAPLARALSRVLDNRAGGCRVTFHRP